jgi:bacteriocin biosynthesis cyclodehydratase domain-containing protein
MADGERLRLKRHYSVVAHSPDQVELRFGVWNPVSVVVSDGSASGRLARLVLGLDGTRTPAELAAAEGVPREEVESLVDYLLSLDALESRPATALDHYLDLAVPWRRDETGPRRIVLLGDFTLAAELERLVAASLPEVPVAVAPGDDPAALAIAERDQSWLADGLAFEERLADFAHLRDAFVVVAQATIDPLALRALNRALLALRVPWLHAALDGPFVLVGPIVVPGRSPCYECLETRVLMNLREGASYQRYKNALAAQAVAVGAPPLAPALAGLLAAHTALEAVNFVATGSSFTVGKLLAVYLPTMELAYNEVLRAPTCPACAPVGERDASELYFDMDAVVGREAS